MIATQKNLDVGHIILDKETLGSKYDEYKKLHNVVVTNEGEEDEYLAFITVNEDAAKLLPTEKKAAEMANIINEEVSLSTIPSVLEEEASAPDVENDPLYENIQSLENEYLSAIEEEVSMHGGRMIDCLHELEEKEVPGDIFFNRFGESEYVIAMSIEHNDALCDLLDLEVISQTDSYDTFMIGMISFAKNTIGGIEKLEHIDAIRNLSAHISTDITSELIDEVSNIKGFEPENKRAFELHIYHSYVEELENVLNVASTRYEEREGACISPMTETDNEEIESSSSIKV